MKKIALLLLAVALVAGCGTKNEENTASNLAFPKAGVYFCPVKDYDGTYIMNEDIFDASEKCESWKSDFWKDTAPNAYENCLNKKKIFVERFQQGTCKPVLKKTHNIGKSGCLFEFATGYNKVLKYSCFGSDIPAVIKEIKLKYEESDL